MKQTNVFATFLALYSVVLQGCAGKSTNDNNVNIPTYTECGGIIPLVWNDKGASARVSYKNGTEIGVYEFCVWTFFPQDAAGEVILKFTENILESWNGITVYTWGGSNLTHYTIPHGNSELAIEAQHFAVAFSAGFDTDSNGFFFDVFVEKAGNVGKNPKAYFFEHDMSEFTYPKDIGHDYYDNNQRASVVLHGPDTRNNREYSLRDLDTEENYDFVDVYQLLGYSTINAPYEFVRR